MSACLLHFKNGIWFNFKFKNLINFGIYTVKWIIFCFLLKNLHLHSMSMCYFTEVFPKSFVRIFLMQNIGECTTSLSFNETFYFKQTYRQWMSVICIEFFQCHGVKKFNQIALHFTLLCFNFSPLERIENSHSPPVR